MHVTLSLLIYILHTAWIFILNPSPYMQYNIHIYNIHVCNQCKIKPLPLPAFQIHIYFTRDMDPDIYIGRIYGSSLVWETGLLYVVRHSIFCCPKTQIQIVNVFHFIISFHFLSNFLVCQSFFLFMIPCSSICRFFYLFTW